jgi:hypothetical protein
VRRRGRPDEQPCRSISPAALSLVEAARLLSKVGGRPVTEGVLRDDVARGAPTNPDGTLNLVGYAAWLVEKETSRE